MPNDSGMLNPPIQYSLLWLIIGLCLILIVAGWYGFVFWNTRKRKLKSLASLPVLSPADNLEDLKRKYLALIDECYASYQQKKVNLRGLHRGLSMAVRYFVFEANHFPAPHLTLADLKRAPFPDLTNVVGFYYDKEFAEIEHGDAAQSAEAAREMVRRWA